MKKLIHEHHFQLMLKRLLALDVLGWQHENIRNHQLVFQVLFVHKLRFETPEALQLQLLFHNVDHHV